MSSFRTQPALNALKIAASLGSSSTPIQVIRSRRNPVDVYLSKLKHSMDENLPDHCHSNDKECLMKHSSIKLVVPVTEILDWLQSTYKEENEVDALLDQLGVRSIHVAYDNLYYPSSEDEGRREWNKIFHFMRRKDDWMWSDIAGTFVLNPTTKSRIHQVLIENFEEFYTSLKGTQLEQFVRPN